MAWTVLSALAFVFLASSVTAQSSSCVDRCNDPFDAGQSCQCNTACVNFGDCCSDYRPVCVATCTDRCGLGLDTTRPCQCNDACVRFGDCCPDHDVLCLGGETTPRPPPPLTTTPSDPGGCGTIADVTEYFWSNDVNGLTSSQISVNWQRQVSDGNSRDRARRRFFTEVDEAALYSKPTVAFLLKLFDNYNSAVGSAEIVSADELAEVDNFYAAIRSTVIFNRLSLYLQCKGLVANEADFQSKFYELWFNLYGRSPSAPAPDSSGLEHTLGEIKPGSSVTGFHSWIRFYEEEKAGNLNYYGYVRRKLSYAVGANFEWKGEVKALGSFLIGTSPEFDLALFTLCALENINKVTEVSLGGINFAIQTWDIAHKDGLQIGSAYVLL